MVRTPKISDAELISRLAKTFKDYGYEGASMGILAKTSGLHKASLYHRFPGGKEQMAQEVLKYMNTWINENIVIPLQDGSVTMSTKDKVRHLLKIFNQLYQGGRESCLLNMLSHPITAKGPFSIPIKNAFKTLAKILAKFSEENGLSKEKAKDRALHVLILLQGGLVLARGTGSTKPFKDALFKIEALLLDT